MISIVMGSGSKCRVAFGFGLGKYCRFFEFEKYGTFDPLSIFYCIFISVTMGSIFLGPGRVRV